MEQKDLKNLMIVELRNKTKYAVIDDYLINDNGFMCLKTYHNLKEAKYNDGNFDIVKVYKYNFADIPLGRGLGYYIDNISKEEYLIWEEKQEQKIGDFTCIEFTAKFKCKNCPFKYFDCTCGYVGDTLFKTLDAIFKDDKENPIYKILLEELNKKVE